jgi:hypothetical protein
MNTKPELPGNSPISVTVIATLAVVFAVGLLTAVNVMFRSSGAPYAQVVAAERACADRTYVSEREQCMRDWFESARRHAVASK